MTELLALRAVVEAPPDAVAAVLLDVRPGGRSPLVVTRAEGPAEGSDDGDEFTVTVQGSRVAVLVDRGNRSVTEQGAWWYRGVTSVEPDPRGAVVHHRVYNVAAGQRWAVRLVSRGPLLAAPAEFARTIAELGRALHATAWVDDQAAGSAGSMIRFGATCHTFEVLVRWTPEPLAPRMTIPPPGV